MAAIKITKENYQKEVAESELPVLIDFWASWCSPCRMLSPLIEEIAGEVTNAKICKINVDEQPELSSAFQVMSIPTLAVLKNGKVVNTAVGVQPKKAILNMLNV